MRLNRGFLNTKRLVTIAINPMIRQEAWIPDFAKSMVKGLQISNFNDVAFQKSIAEYVNYNGQKVSLKNFIDDQIDVEARRTIIIENNIIGDYSLYGYGEPWTVEYDPTPNSMYGYYDNGWILEPESDYITLTGYYDNGWVLEEKTEISINIYIHNDVYSTLTTNQLDELTAKLNRYIIAPYNNSFEIKGYETYVTYDGAVSENYINTGIIPNETTNWKDRVLFTNTTDTNIFGITYTDGSFNLGASNDKAYAGYGSTELETLSILENTVYDMEINGTKKKSYVDGTLGSDAYDYFEQAPLSITFGSLKASSSVTYSTYNDYGGYIEKDGVKTYFTPHIDGYYFDNFGNRYFNKESLYNEFPLKVTMITY